MHDRVLLGMAGFSIELHACFYCSEFFAHSDIYTIQRYSTGLTKLIALPSIRYNFGQG